MRSGGHSSGKKETSRGSGAAAAKGKGDGGIRIARVEREVQSLISRFLASSYKGELPGLVTVAMVRMPPDLKTAKVLISFFNATDKEEAEGVLLLQKRAPEIQKFLNDKLALRFCPRLTFVRDETTDKVMKIDKILREIDDQSSRASTPASPATSSDE